MMGRPRRYVAVCKGRRKVALRRRGITSAQMVVVMPWWHIAVSQCWWKIVFGRRSVACSQQTCVDTRLVRDVAISKGGGEVLFGWRSITSA